MLNLARHYNDRNEVVNLKNISDEEEISIRYLEQIIVPLRIHKLVKSIRGAGGGYALARQPSQIKLSEILQALEGSCSLVECVEDKDFCHRIPICATHEVWKEATQILKNYFESVTLQRILEISQKKTGSIPSPYF